MTTVSSHLHLHPWEKPDNPQVAVPLSRENQRQQQKAWRKQSSQPCAPGRTPETLALQARWLVTGCSLALWGKHLQGRRTRCQG